MAKPKTKKVTRPGNKVVTKFAKAGAKRAKNLFLDVETLRRAEEYSRQHGRTVSRLVENYLLALTREQKPDDDEALSPVVRELRGIAAGSGLSEADYKEHLWQKYMRDGG